MSNPKSRLNTSFFKQYFPTPRLVRVGVWLATSLGDQPLDKALAKRAGLTPFKSMFDYADALIEYANNRGWGDELQKLLREDLRDALDNREDEDPKSGRYAYLESRRKLLFDAEDLVNAVAIYAREHSLSKEDIKVATELLQVLIFEGTQNA